MIKQPDDLLPLVSDFLNTSSTRWSFGNQILYDMCAQNPSHEDADIIVGKIWLIGRSYAAAIERRRTNTDFDDDFYYEIAAPKLLSIGSELDNRITAINQFPVLTEQNLDFVLETHKYLMDAFYDITNLEKRSLASKYLHFHCPNLFLIYDSRASQEAKKCVKLDRQKVTAHYSCNCDKEYADFCVRVLELRQFIAAHFGKLLLPRELDNLLLKLDNSFSMGNKGKYKYGKIIAKGKRDKKDLLVECSLTENGLEISFNGVKDSRLEGIILEEMKEHHPIGGTYHPKTEKLNLVSVLSGYFFDHAPDIEVEGKIETLPYKEGVVY